MTKAAVRLGRGFYWQDMTVGDRYRTYGRTVTPSDISAFVNLAGMIEVLFTNAEYRRSEAAIKGNPSPGALVFALAEGLALNATAQETGLAFLGTTMTIKGPVLEGDTIDVEIEVLEVRQESKGTRGLVKTRNTVRNQRGETVMIYEPLRLMQGR
ncbi:MaoC family dehydratase [Rhodovulum sulfidophilum]|uniref:MaoC family dehydratase n=1 Tax=Rhodovulum sulfidophilum TaxID=35806 RepID=UPI00138A099A|nr:MaoC family dehydratase N-terminal domain-containing protein [Rhodovulum sulfidophilum]MBL3562082.1 MaoC family dehydratase N-terminal domain-containing protein [Rhodovulum sulfidophilum]MBL3584988.1 MaoC family dehydratase N-terminal domain-containing protein [Rhodovulum sulfidophilum]NDK33868.1 acyl dehydratase [Rhodovulum sulfidophilum]